MDAVDNSVTYSVNGTGMFDVDASSGVISNAAEFPVVLDQEVHVEPRCTV